MSHAYPHFKSRSQSWDAKVGRGWSKVFPPFFFNGHIGMHSQLCVQYSTLAVWSLHLYKQSNLIMTRVNGLLFVLNQKPCHTYTTQKLSVLSRRVTTLKPTTSHIADVAIVWPMDQLLTSRLCTRWNSSLQMEWGNYHIRTKVNLSFIQHKHSIPL